MRPVFVLLLAVLAGLSAVASAQTQSATTGQILFWASSQPFVESWVRSVPVTDAQRLARLRTMFAAENCKPEQMQEEPVGKPIGSNLICTLPGADAATILVAAHYEHEGKGEGAVENWSGAVMLPLLFHALSATPRHYTFVFAALDGAKGARTFMQNRRADWPHFRAMFALDDLGLGPAKYCAFNQAPLQEFGLAQFLSGASALLPPSVSPERTDCRDLLKLDDTQAFRQANIPALVIHSVSPLERSLPGSVADTAAAINGDRYYESYQLLATYLSALDRVLDQALAGGQVASSAVLKFGQEESPGHGAAIAAPAMASAASAESRPVAVDVVVTDKHGVPVPNLRKEDFVVLDNKQAQTISLFEEHPIRLTERIAPTQPPGSVTNVPTTPPDAVNVLLLDELNTPPDPAYVRKPILNYLKTIPPGMQLAVFALGSRLWMLQGPAADSSRLLAALDNKDGKTSALAGASMENGEPTGRDAQPLMRNSLGAFQADTPGFPFDVRTRLTLAAFQQLARYLSGVPGRKNVIWFSQLFPLSPNALASASQVGSAPRHETDEEYAAALRPTLDLLAWARVAIYPVDSRGVLPAGVGRFASINAGSGSTPEHHDMKLLAESTGGEAFYDTSQLKDALTRLTAVGGHYYTLTYQPANRKEDGGFRNIVVKLNDGSYRLAYRRGYYADPPFSPSSVASDILDPVFRTALEPSGPPATQILLKVRATPVLATPAPMPPKTGIAHYTIDYAADPRGVRLDAGSDGQRHGNLIFAAVAYDANNKQINSFWHPLQVDLRPAEYALAQTSGIFFQKEFDVPAGTVALRVGVYDPASGRMGTLDVPLTLAVTQP